MAEYSRVLPLGQGCVRTALDVGSGTGGFAVAAASWGITVLCVDVNADHAPYLQVLSARGLLGILHDVRSPLPHGRTDPSTSCTAMTSCTGSRPARSRACCRTGTA